MLVRWITADSIGILLLGFGAWSLVDSVQALDRPSPLLTPVALVASTLFLLWSRGLYTIQAKYLDLKDVWNLFQVGVASALLLLLVIAAQGVTILGGVLVATLYALGFSPALCAIRSLHRRLEVARPVVGDTHRVRTLILGGGDAGEMVIREIRRMPSPTHHIVGIIDDDPRKSYTKMHGVPVVGATKNIEELVEKYDADEILITLPSADGELMRRLTDVCGRTRAHVRTLPGLQDLLHEGGETTNVAGQIREVEVSDLLRRKTVPEDAAGVAELLRGQVVLITGAGGSIGSELARQAVRHSPAKLILLGKGENSIFEIEQEIVRDGFPAPKAMIADVRDVRAMDRLFARYRPSIVLHAAAHKHVPLMQGNAVEAVRNNVFGTINVVEASIRHGAKHLILVSTDKAVNPGNVMGATKRVAELAVRALTHGTSTKSSVVRFGNVLGSRGSLVPMLKAQIARGGPVRITHPDMTRFFMTIPEAVGLIFQAGRQGGSGETFILDMGEPIRILDIANDLIRLSGFGPNRPIPIVFTGPRPGEKLEEELSYEFETLVPTVHPKIRAAHCQEAIDPSWLKGGVDELRYLCEIGSDEEVREALMRIAGEPPTTPISPIPDESLSTRRTS